MFGYKEKYNNLTYKYYLKEEVRVQRDQYKWKIDFNGSPAYSAEEKARLEGLYEYATDLIIELNNIL